MKLETSVGFVMLSNSKLPDSQHHERTKSYPKFKLQVANSLRCNSNMLRGMLWKRKEVWTPRNGRDIHFLEIKATFVELRDFTKNLLNCEILIRIDLSTTTEYIILMTDIRYQNCVHHSQVLCKITIQLSIWHCWFSESN